VGSNFDDFLREQRLLAVAKATAIKRVIAFLDIELAEPAIRSRQPRAAKSSNAEAGKRSWADSGPPTRKTAKR
jgi:hypothetical protein